MKLAEKSIEDFTRALGSKSPTPGGGSTAALSGALGASLIAKVSVITAGRRAFADQAEEFQRITESAETLQKRLLSLIDEDSSAYEAYRAVQAMPKDSEEVQTALKNAALVPYAILSASLEGLRLAKQVSSSYYLVTASDLGLAAQSLKTAAQGAELTILINLASISDAAFGKQYLYESRALLEESLSLADEIYGEVRMYLQERF
ncbi:MAG: cyclodeaminase/cyclohydrolase family protein [Spirochaetaceae bacterium]|jgi:formiminotetrahydrofolate cyclodeaminase|nr:cyclodeaminase/cyclohydrolase family protein [Spirochaetaceae bacterium]